MNNDYYLENRKDIIRKRMERYYRQRNGKLPDVSDGLRDEKGRFIKGNKGIWLGKNRSEIDKLKMGRAKKGKPSWKKGIKVNLKEATRLKELSLANSKVYFGANHPNWQGGITYEKYPKEFFDGTLKERIRKRDGYKCQLCSKTENEELRDYNRRLSINHIDYNKKNCADNNLITLCVKCNAKVNKNRKYWTKYFTIILRRLYGK